MRQLVDDFAGTGRHPAGSLRPGRLCMVHEAYVAYYQPVPVTVGRPSRLSRPEAAD
jgi:hypothetical protein